MANQIVVSAGAKVRNLQDVIIGTSGVLTSLGFDVANGVPRLDVNGKILVSQLPNSVMEYKGTWNVSTNTPTLINGVGNQGDVYLVEGAAVGGTSFNFGAGPITFFNGDQAIYSGSIWQRASGATGTVTSVAITESGDSLNITGSPITTSGTINIGFNGTNLQYVNGAGNLTTFPTLTGYVPYSGATANVNLGEYGLSGGFIGFDTTPTSTPTAQGTMYWNADKESVDVIMNGVTGSVMQDTFYNVKNQTGATITKGTIVRANGTVGASGRILIAPFLADGSYDSKVCLGVTAETILNGEDGKVTAFGAIRQIDTSAFANGTILYASPTTAGGFTSTEPTNPSNIVTIAIVIYSDVNNGEIFVRPTFVDNAADIAASLGYTPANDALVVHLAGTETITGAKTFTATSLTLAPTSGGGTLNLKQDAFLGATNGYTSLTSSGSDFAIIAATGVSTSKQAVFSLSSLGSTLRTYTLPDASGTLALTSDIPSLAGYVTLGTTQTITGAKTFSAYTTFTSTVDITSGLTFSNSGFTLLLQPPTLSVNRTVTLPNATGTLALTSDIPSITGLVPYTGATTNVDLGGNSLYLNNSQAVFGRNLAGSTSYALIGVNASNKVQIDTSALGVVFGGTIGNGTYTYTLPSATGTLALTSDLTGGTVTSVAALTIGTTGTDLSSSVANSTTTPVITLNVPTASATNRGALSSADWTTFNNKQSALTNPVLASGTWTSGYLPKINGTYTIGNSLVYDNGTNVGIGTITPNGKLTINSTGDNNIRLENGSELAIIRVLTTGALDIWSHGDTANEIFFRQGTGSGTVKMTLDASGNLGLGVTPSAWGSILKAFQLGSYGAFIAGRTDGGGISQVFVGANSYYDGSNWVYANSSFASRYYQADGAHNWQTTTSGTQGGTIAWTAAMTLTAAGRLLLGTTTESTYLLDVNGTGRFAASYTASGTVAIQTWQRAGGAVSADMTYNDANTSMNFGTSTSHTLNLKTNNTTALSLASTGAATFTGSITSTNSTGAISMVAAGSSDTKNSSGSFNIYDTTNNRGWGLQQDASYKLNFWHYNGGWTSVANISGTGAATFSSTCTATGFFESSDSRLKTLIQDNYQTKGIASITPKLYTKNGKVELGYYAQDFVGILDSAVSKGSDDMLSLSYREVLVAKVYALEQEIKELKAKMN